MGILKDYVRLMLFAAGLLVGVQVPNFADQYEKRISAHFLEAKANFSGYEETAARHFGADVEALLKHYETSTDRVFRDDARNLKQIHARIQMFTAEKKALQAGLWKRIWHIVFSANRAVVRETLAEFTYTVPLNPVAIGCGLILGLAGALSFELLFFGVIGWVLRPKRQVNAHAG